MLNAYKLQTSSSGHLTLELKTHDSALGHLCSEHLSRDALLQTLASGQPSLDAQQASSLGTLRELSMCMGDVCRERCPDRGVQVDMGKDVQSRSVQSQLLRGNILSRISTQSCPYNVVSRTTCPASNMQSCEFNAR